MSERKNLLFAMVLTVIVAATVFVIVTGSAAKPQDNTLTETSIGVVDYAQIQDKLNDFVNLKELLKTYDAELNSFAALKRQEMASYYAELEQKKEAEALLDPKRVEELLEEWYSPLSYR